MNLRPDFVPERTCWFNRLHPAARTSAIVVTGFTAIVYDKFPVLFATFFLATIGAAISIGKLRWLGIRLLGLTFAIVPFLLYLILYVPEAGARPSSFAPHVSWYGAEQAGKMVLRMTTLFLLGSTLFAGKQFERLTKILSPLPVVGKLATMPLLTLNYLQLFLKELSQLRISLRVRGFRNKMSWHAYHTASAVLGSLIVRSVDRAERVNHALRARGFTGTFPNWAPPRWQWGDTVTFVLSICCLTVVSIQKAGLL